MYSKHRAAVAASPLPAMTYNSYISICDISAELFRPLWWYRLSDTITLIYSLGGLNPIGLRCVAMFKVKFLHLKQSSSSFVSSKYNWYSVTYRKMPYIWQNAVLWTVRKHQLRLGPMVIKKPIPPAAPAPNHRTKSQPSKSWNRNSKAYLYSPRSF